MGLFKHKDIVSKPALNVIVVGAGNVGAALVEQLSKEGNNITLIDQNTRRVAELTNLYDVMGVIGNGASYNIQKEAGIDDADLFIAVTDSDELNLLCCTVAKRNRKCATIARVRTPEYSEEMNYLKERLGLAMIINPDLETAREVARLFYLPTALEINSFAHEQAELIKFKVPEGNVLDGKTISEFAKYDNSHIMICAIERNGEVSIPNGNTLIQAGDLVSFVTPRKKNKNFINMIGFKSNPVRDCMIIGGGRSAYYLAMQLIHMGIKVKIIEVNPDRCERLSVALPEAIVINGDGTDEELLKEEGIETIDSFVSLTGIDEQNIFLTMHAKKVSNTKVITKVKRTNFKDVISDLDLGSVVYPRYITLEAIIAYARARRASLNSDIETMYHMYDHRVEAIEFRVAKPCNKLTDIPIKDLKLKDNLTLTFINRKGKIILPTGEDVISVGDTIMVVTTNNGFNSIEDIIR
ncbi:MAG: Trk system potassium transporter TrkA [Lachnospiraceae bacterium]|nr:Trk system potassium transporter TrkA [Lachnospiraceae bacterium]